MFNDIVYVYLLHNSMKLTNNILQIKIHQNNFVMDIFFLSRLSKEKP